MGEKDRDGCSINPRIIESTLLQAHLVFLCFYDATSWMANHFSKNLSLMEFGLSRTPPSCVASSYQVEWCTFSALFSTFYFFVAIVVVYVRGCIHLIRRDEGLSVVEADLMRNSAKFLPGFFFLLKALVSHVRASLSISKVIKFWDWTSPAVFKVDSSFSSGWKD